MSTDTISQILVLFTGALCLFIAAQLGRRKLDRANDLRAWNAFRIWWLGLGLSTAGGALRMLFALQGVESLNVYMWLGVINTALTCLALWGLLFYLVYLYTGNSGLALPLGIFYLLLFTGLAIYTFGFLHPTGVVLEAGTATVQYETEASPLYQLIVGLLVLLPQLLAGLAYFSFYFRVRERVQKYRVLMVSIAIFAWFGLPLVVYFAGLTTQAWWPITSQVIALLAVLAIYWAYYPPQFIQQRFKVASI